MSLGYEMIDEGFQLTFCTWQAEQAGLAELVRATRRAEVLMSMLV